MYTVPIFLFPHDFFALCFFFRYDLSLKNSSEYLKQHWKIKPQTAYFKICSNCSIVCHTFNLGKKVRPGHANMVQIK